MPIDQLSDGTRSGGRTWRWTRAARAAAVLAALLTAACGSDAADDPAAAPTTEAPAEGPGGDDGDGDAAAAPIAVDWTARTVSPSTAGDWSIEFCEGESPHVCFSNDGGATVTGAAELSDWPASARDAIKAARQKGASEVEALEALGAEAVGSLKADREKGCGADYVVTADESERVDVGGHAGVRYGWTATRGGKAVERVITYATIDGKDRLYLLVAGALEPEGCLERMNEFRLAELEGALPVLDRVAAGTRLPPPTGP